MFGFSKRGQMGMTGTVITVIGVAIAIIMAIIVMAKLSASVDTTGFTASQNSTYNTLLSNVYTSLGLLGISIIVLGAAAIFVVLKILG